MKKKTIGLALGGGGARGCAHIGVIHALQEAGIQIDAVAGTSIGALVGAFFASGDLALLETQLLNTHWQKILSYFDPTFSRQGFLKGKRIEHLLEQTLTHSAIESMPMPYTAVATDLETGQEVWFEKGDPVEAIRASIAIPIVFKPVKKGSQLLVDGGLVNPLPVNVLKKAGIDLIIAVDINHTFIQERLKYNSRQRRLKFKKGILDPPESEPTLFDISESSLFTLQNQITEKNLQLYPPDVLIRPELNYSHLFDFKRAKELIEVGYKTTKKHLSQILHLL